MLASFASMIILFIMIGLYFSDCKFNCHKKCAPLVPKDCTGDLPVGESMYAVLYLCICDTVTSRGWGLEGKPCTI